MTECKHAWVAIPQPGTPPYTEALKCVRCGQRATRDTRTKEISLTPFDVRSAPDSGEKADIPGLPRWAITGLYVYTRSRPPVFAQ
jgi:hypothetical protein